MNLDLKTGVPFGEVLRDSLLRYEKSISDDPAFLISKVPLCPTSSGLKYFISFQSDIVMRTEDSQTVC